MADATQVQIRRDTAANLAGSTPVLAELGYDTTNKRIIIGDGTTAGGINHVNSRDMQTQNMISGTVTGTGNAINIAIAPLPVLPLGQYFKVVFKAIANNAAGGVTIAINGGTPVAAKKPVAGALVDYAANDIVANFIYEATLDGTQWQLKPVANASNGSYQFLGKLTAAGSTALNFYNLMTPDFDSYDLQFKNVTVSAQATFLLVRVSTDNATMETGSYTNIPTGSGNGVSLRDATSGLQQNPGDGNALNGKVTIYSPNSSVRSKSILGKVHYNANIVFEPAGYWGANTPIVGIGLHASTGNMPSGEVLLYGIRNS